MKKPYKISYVMYSSMGKVRRNNEDNYYVDKKYREDLTFTEDECISGELSSEDNNMLAVFDGMGGEACGEVASLVAAKTCKDFSSNHSDFEEYLYELANLCNQEILDETEKRSLVLMGTTCCMIQFSKEDIYVLNVGDSRIYKLSHKKLSQVSTDHVAYGYANKAPLTKFLGMVVEKEPLNPYLAMGKYKVGDMFLLCTDGITDMVNDEGIEKILSQKKPLNDLAKELVDIANELGGIDNSTVVLCKVSH